MFVYVHVCMSVATVKSYLTDRPTNQSTKECCIECLHSFVKCTHKHITNIDLTLLDLIFHNSLLSKLVLICCLAQLCVTDNSFTPLNNHNINNIDNNFNDYNDYAFHHQQDFDLDR